MMYYRVPFKIYPALLAATIALIPVFSVAQTPNVSAANDDGAADAAAVGNTEINLKNAEISAIIRIFSKKTGRNYILDENVKGKITIYLPGKVSSDEAVRILDSILALKGFTSVPVAQNLWKIIPAKDAKNTTIPLETGPQKAGIATAAVVTRIVALKYVSADDMKSLLSPLVSPEGLINGYSGTNSLILIDSEDNIERIVHIIHELDIPSSDRDMTIIPVENANATDIAAKLNEVLGTSDTGSKNNNSGDRSNDLLRNRFRGNGDRGSLPGQPINPQLQLTSASNNQNVTGPAREPKISADDRTNSVIVVADEDTTARVRALIAQLDSKVDLAGNKFYVYRCQHASAQELSDVLGGLGGNGTSSGSRSTTSGTGSNARATGGSQGGTGSSGFGSSTFGGSSTSGGFGSSGGTGSSTQNRLASSSRNLGQSPTQPKTASNGAVQLGQNISITADPATNSLIIYSNKSDYDRVLALLTELDIKRRQVLVEAMLLEVGIDDSNQFGLSFLGSTGGLDGGLLLNSGSILSTLANPAAIQNFAVAAASSGTLTLPNGVTVPTQSALLTALQSNSDVNVLSAPTILTTDNEEAEIVVGENVPFLSSTSTSTENLNNTFNQVDRQDVGITLRLTPQISSGEFVTLKLFTEVSSVLADTANSALGPTTTVRTSDTTVITKDSQMVVTGGLISDNLSSSDSGTPYLKDIPVLGHLFKQTSNARQKNNLLILITPRIIKDQYDYRDITISQRDKMERQMAELGAWPDRHEIMHNPEIDKVSEATPWNGTKPSTILPPNKRIEGTSSQRISLEQMPNDGSAAINLKAAPALPSTHPLRPPEPHMQPSGDESTASIGSTADTHIAAPESRSRFVVLEMDKGASAPANAPFKVDEKGRLLGLAIGPDSPETARQFFSAGQHCRYDMNGKQVPFTVVGVYDDEASAHKLHKHLPSQWYALSPYEIMNLGSGPWETAP